MWKFKKEYMRAAIMSLVILIYTILVKDGFVDKDILFNHLLNNFYLMFVLTIILFNMLLQSYNFELTIWRFNKLKDYAYFDIRNMLSSLSVFFVSLTLSQMIIYLIFVPSFSIVLLVYHNLILLWLISLTYIFIIIGKSKNQFKRSIIVFVIWSCLYITFSMNPDSPISLMMPFMALKAIDVYEIGRLVILSFIILFYAYMRLKDEGRSILE